VATDSGALNMYRGLSVIMIVPVFKEESNIGQFIGDVYRQRNVSTSLTRFDQKALLNGAHPE
jgi:hypothetical protein